MMSPAQWFLLGMMAGWTPCLLFLGWCLQPEISSRERERRHLLRGD